ncbi:hypothetical protein, partial [Sinorhizobium sp. Sb3]|uniref:hypothetical protein n=1 Tax=Sinorhizobium sp. Sb3 TaxID=1358417 RepID=UPI001AECCAA7
PAVFRPSSSERRWDRKAEVMALSLTENIAFLTSIMTAFDLQQIPARRGGRRKNDRAFHGEMA